MIGVLFILLFSGFYIVVAVGLAATLAFYFGFEGNISQIQMVVWNTANSSVLAAAALFIFLGEILMRCRLSDRLYSAAIPWVSWLPGGLLHVNIVGCTIFAACSGSSSATAASLGVIANKEMKVRGYHPRLGLSSIAGGATLGILIPPSIPMILYAFFTEASIGRLFIAGVVPGIILSLTFIGWNVFAAIRNPDMVPRERKYSWRERIVAAKDFGPIVMVIMGMLGGIYFGVITPNEAAAFGSTISILLAIMYREFTLSRLWMAMKDTAVITSFILILMVSGSMVAYYMAHSGLAAYLVETVGGLPLPAFAIFGLIAIIYIVMGCFIDSYSIIVLTVPISFPLMMALGYDPVWFGIVVVILIEIGLITPPYGINLFVLDGIAGGGYYNTIVRGVLPYLVILIMGLILIYVVPQIALWLPSMMMGSI